MNPLSLSCSSDPNVMNSVFTNSSISISAYISNQNTKYLMIELGITELKSDVNLNFIALIEGVEAVQAARSNEETGSQ